MSTTISYSIINMILLSIIVLCYAPPDSIKTNGNPKIVKKRKETSHCIAFRRLIEIEHVFLRLKINIYNIYIYIYIYIYIHIYTYIYIKYIYIYIYIYILYIHITSPCSCSVFFSRCLEIKHTFTKN